MTRHRHFPAQLPPEGLPGLRPDWSRHVPVMDADGAERLWHVLDSGRTASLGELSHGTLLCVHGNPTWSYLWRRLLESAPPGWRVVAPDQLGMGFSERLTSNRTLAQRIDDLGRLTDALGIAGPVVTVAHDWGGPISLGWGLAHRRQLRGIVLTNTAVHQPSSGHAPALIRLARTPGLREAVCVRTPVFVRAATAVSHPMPPKEVRRAYAEPYRGAARRVAVADFVADIPLEESHRSMRALVDVRERLGLLADLPALVLWGPRDPVFGEVHLRDLLERLPQADVERFDGASHLVMEDAPAAATAVTRWVADLDGRQRRPASAAQPTAAQQWRPLGAALGDHAGSDRPAIVEVGRPERSITSAALAVRVESLAAGLIASGVRPGQRVALLVPPGVELTVALYGCWRAGAVVVVADAGLGLTAMGRALRGAGPDHVVGTGQGLVAARAMRVPGRRIGVGPLPPGVARALGATVGLADLERLGRDRPAPPAPDPEAEAAVVFTSGATGRPKGVAYRHRQVRAQLDAVRSAYDLADDDRLVAAFAPFALLGPGLGIAAAVPDVDVTRPASLTAAALADAATAVDATVVFAAPAALRNVVATAGALTPGQREALGRVRLLVSAGAPVPAALLRRVGEVLPRAALHTPYGMTEVLPVTDVSLDDIDDAGPGNGVLVGSPLDGVDVAVSPIGADGSVCDELTRDPDRTGEICVRAAHMRDRYDRLWAANRTASGILGWHRTGDVGHLDAAGRLWVEGRLAHVITTADGVITPVGVEQRAESLAGVRLAAVVGVGPTGAQQVVVVHETERPHRRWHGPLASAELTRSVRAVAGVPVAAVLRTPALPVDVRHQSKIDRRRVAAWAAQVLAGGRTRRTP